MKFTKMHGAGNDYIYMDCREAMPPDPEALARRLSDRHFSIGGDGLVLICPSEKADVRMRMFNADGSEGRMCGNAIRCVAKYVYDRGIVPREDILVETLSGIKSIHVFSRDGKAVAARVDMGPATGLFPGETTLHGGTGEMLLGVPIEAAGCIWEGTTVSMGNPHLVIFLKNVASLDLPALGPAFENHPAFPHRINTEFVRVLDESTLEMRVWERGSGETLACGTGACAAAAAAVANGFCRADKDITVRLLGGELSIRLADGTIYMTGEAVEVFSGEIEPMETDR